MVGDASLATHLLPRVHVFVRRMYVFQLFATRHRLLLAVLRVNNNIIYTSRFARVILAQGPC